MTVIREAREADVQQVRDLFVHTYGVDYPFQQFYDTGWLKKAVFSDDTLFMVAENGGQVVATGSVMRTVGTLTDLVGELGRLVAAPSKLARGAAHELVTELLQRSESSVHFGFGEIRTVHAGAQKLAEAFGWTAVGFEPMKYQLSHRESVVFYAHLHPQAVELRRNNPRVIPEAGLLAQTVLKQMGLPVDAIIDDEMDGYPTGHAFEIERLAEKGVSPLLRIERGRVSHREIFGDFSLTHGFFNIAVHNSHYLIARDGGAVLGAVGFTHDPIDNKVRIFELIEFDDAVKGYLLAAVDKIAVEEFKVAYQEVDVSAHSPKIQRTFERLGFMPVVYCPAMVFDRVERLDVIRMAKLTIPYDLGRMRLLENGARIKQIVEQGLEERLIGMKITAGARRAEFFDGLLEGDLQHLARIALLHEYPAGTVIIHKGEEPDILYIIVEGEVEVRLERQPAVRLGPGKIFGEMAFLERNQRSADVVFTKKSKVIEIALGRLERLMETYPRIGFTVTRNLARALSKKLRASGSGGA